MLEKLCLWTMRAGASRYAVWVLLLVAFAESSVFPVPVDVLLFPMVLAARERAWWLATLATLASVAGGFAGYAIGWGLYESVGRWIVELYGMGDQFAYFETKYAEWGAWVVMLFGISPLPYKFVTIASGVFTLDLWVFGIASLAARGIRFFAVCALLWLFGPIIRRIFERWMWPITIAFLVLLAGGFVAVGYVL
ncbi:MAG: DedA family protein [Alphaproteobacteria bacterium]|nr:DedA family protein [Alphaproteobacteria bacterium]